MYDRRRKQQRAGWVLVLAVLLAVPSSARESAEVGELSGPLGLLGISSFSCRCSQILDDDSGRWRWVFVSEPTVDGIAPDGPADGRLEEGDVIVAVDGMLITTQETPTPNMASPNRKPRRAARRALLFCQTRNSRAGESMPSSQISKGAKASGSINPADSASRSPRHGTAK